MINTIFICLLYGMWRQDFDCLTSALDMSLMLLRPVCIACAHGVLWHLGPDQKAVASTITVGRRQEFKIVFITVAGEKIAHTVLKLFDQLLCFTHVFAPFLYGKGYDPLTFADEHFLILKLILPICFVSFRRN